MATETVIPVLGAHLYVDSGDSTKLKMNILNEQHFVTDDYREACRNFVNRLGGNDYVNTSIANLHFTNFY